MSNWVYRRPPMPQLARRLSVPIFFAPTGEMQGSAVITFSETAALGALAGMVGSASINFSETGALGGYHAIVGSAAIVFSETAALDAFAFGDLNGLASITFKANLGIPQPELAIVPPKFRSIDGKTLADHFNRGLPEVPDYTWEGHRKFYQDDSPA